MNTHRTLAFAALVVAAATFFPLVSHAADGQSVNAALEQHIYDVTRLGRSLAAKPDARRELYHKWETLRAEGLQLLETVERSPELANTPAHDLARQCMLALEQFKELYPAR